jgi:hypothetical protein
VIDGDGVDVLLIAFARPDLLERAVEPLREARIRRVFLALDGPRADHPEDEELIDACEQVVRDVLGPTAPIEVLRRTQNIGMKRACVGAIDWFFTQTDAGVIIEDDCVIDPTFVPFAAELLDRYRSDKRVMGICGTDFVGAPRPPLGASYGFVRNFGVWGWATWARAWRHNDPDLSGVSTEQIQRVLRRQPGSGVPFRWFWARLLEACRAGRNPSWSFPWVFSVWQEGGVFVHPNRNLVSNIGHDERATQTGNPGSRLSALPTRPMVFPLMHPTALVLNAAHDRWSDQHIKGIGWSLIAKSTALKAAQWLRRLRWAPR